MLICAIEISNIIIIIIIIIKTNLKALSKIANRQATEGSFGITIGSAKN